LWRDLENHVADHAGGAELGVGVAIVLRPIGELSNLGAHQQ
jgi:hypothetical protein